MQREAAVGREQTEGGHERKKSRGEETARTVGTLGMAGQLGQRGNNCGDRRGDKRGDRGTNSKFLFS